MRPRNTPNGDTHDGMMTAHGVLTSPIEWNIRYSGTVISATGNSSDEFSFTAWGSAS